MATLFALLYSCSSPADDPLAATAVQEDITTSKNKLNANLLIMGDTLTSIDELNYLYEDFDADEFISANPVFGTVLVFDSLYE